MQRDGFTFSFRAWVEMTRRGVEQLRVHRELAEQGLKLLESDDPEVKRGLEEMRDFYTFAEREFPRVFERWEHAVKSKENS